MLRRSWSILWILAVWTTAPMLAGGLSDDVPSTQPATASSQPAAGPANQPATQPATVESDETQAARLATTAMEETLSGKFVHALTLLDEAHKLAPTNATVLAAESLLKDYLTQCNRMETERTREYTATVARIERTFLAEESLPKLAEKGLDKKLREAAQELAKSFNRISLSDALESETDPAAAAKLRTDTLGAIDKCLELAGKVASPLDGDESEYARSFRALRDALTRELRAYRACWHDVQTAQSKARLAGAAQLRAAEDALLESMGNLEAMIAEKPWRVGLSQARLAMQLVPDPAAPKSEEWYRKLVSRAETLGEEFIARAEWQDAMSVYTSLEDLDPDSEAYKAKSKATQRHVRVLNLYGAKPQPATATQPAEGENDGIGDWRDLTRGVDADMVKRAITQLNQYYVTAVDYRKLARGALESVKVLAETPQAANSFPALADAQKNKEFLQAVDQALDSLEKKDRVTHLQLQLALNTVLLASERTVKVPVEVLAVEFTDGFLDEMDKFSSMVWPHDVPDFQKHIRGQFFGVGIQITKEPGEPLKVVTPLPDSPALKQGLKVGDEIVAVDGRETADLPLDRLVQMIMGPKGSKVTLRIRRQGLEPFDVSIIRDEIRIETVKGWQRKPDGGNGEWDYLIDRDSRLGYIRVTQFTDGTYADLVAALNELKAQQARGLILDLRFNPGGLLTSATQVADEFLRAGRIVSTRGRQVRQTESNATAYGRYLDGDLVVLVNEGSASAAEIVSGALKDWRRGVIVGQRSFGKGSVQNVIPIQDHPALLKLTTAYYYLPTGRLLHRRNGDKDWGVDPDVRVLVTPRQMKRWMDLRRKTDLLDREADLDDLRDTLDKQLDTDLQLRTGVLLLKLMRLQQSRPAA